MYILSIIKIKVLNSTFFNIFYILKWGDNMGLTSSSTGKVLLNDDIEELKNKCDYTIAIARKP